MRLLLSVGGGEAAGKDGKKCAGEINLEGERTHAPGLDAAEAGGSCNGIPKAERDNNFGPQPAIETGLQLSIGEKNRKIKCSPRAPGVSITA